MRLTTRVLVVDHSATIRSIMKKTLTATRFAFEIGEAADAANALRLVGDDHFDVIFSTRTCRRPAVLSVSPRSNRCSRISPRSVMASAPDESLVAKARALGAAFLQKPFFPADIENALCGYYGLRPLNPRRI